MAGRPMETFRAVGITFIGEQGGLVEAHLKGRFVSFFMKRPAVRRAYLARVRYAGTADDFDIALCLRVADRDGEHPFMREVGKIFTDMFNESEHLDVLLLSDAQEAELSKVCRPFYRAQRSAGVADGVPGLSPPLSGARTVLKVLGRAWASAVAVLMICLTLALQMLFLVFVMLGMAGLSELFDFEIPDGMFLPISVGVLVLYNALAFYYYFRRGKAVVGLGKEASVLFYIPRAIDTLLFGSERISRRKGVSDINPNGTEDGRGTHAGR